ncbi:hypothetical protein CHELA20_53216 [Hyphomicrobiales bacterium]|nr:hypothetical protein CHELA41_21707 [Hyphomicrobiales bacterium]CAH1683806.1 hypothetical protein CHELA20_53216 [Hyphomicrobiales bacterium]
MLVSQVSGFGTTAENTNDLAGYQHTRTDRCGHATNANLLFLNGFRIKMNRGGLRYGVPEGIRTPDLRFRKPLLYPAELPGQSHNRDADAIPLEKRAFTRSI